MKTNLKHWMSCLPDSEIDAEVDAGRRLVTLRLDDFDNQLVASFVTRVLPEQGLVAFRDDAAVERVGQLTPPAPFQLAIFLGGREHAAQVVRLAGGQVTVWLENPSKGHERTLKALLPGRCSCFTKPAGKPSSSATCPAAPSPGTRRPRCVSMTANER